MAEIIHLADRRSSEIGTRRSLLPIDLNFGNGAREALIEIAQPDGPRAACYAPALWADWVLLELYRQGFTVTRIPPEPR